MIKNLLIVTGLWKHKPLANLSNSSYNIGKKMAHNTT